MSLRSVAYWTFVTCDDPKGVVECKTIRQSKKKTQNWNTYEEEQSSKEVCSGVNQEQNSKLRVQQGSMESQRDCYDELRQVIRESFARNNLFPPTDKSTSAPSNPNIIAKLMGLEQMPSKVFKQMEKFSDPRRRLFDIDLPAPTKPRFNGMVQFKGRLGSVDAKYVSNFLTKTSAVEEGPPIVIMRPRNIDENYGRTRPPKMSCAVEVPEGKKDTAEIQTKKTVSSRTNKTEAMLDHTRKAAAPNTRNKTEEMLDHTRKAAAAPNTRNKTEAILDRTRKAEAANTGKKTEATVEHTRKAAARNKTEAMVEHKKKAAARNTRKRAAVKDVKTEDVGRVKQSKGVRECNASNIQRITSVKSNIPKKNLRKGKDNSKASAALVEDIGSTASQQMITEQVRDSSCVSISEKSGNKSISQTETTSKCSEDGRCIFCPDKTLRYQLLSSVSFLNYAKELFDTAVVLPTEHHSPEVVAEDSLLIDCAKEILKRKSLCDTMMWNPSSAKLLITNVGTRELVGEVSDGIEDLRSYSNRSLCWKVERDLQWNEDVTGGWDFGWRKGYTTEAVNEVVRDIERLVLNEVVSNVVVEFLPG